MNFGEFRKLEWLKFDQNAVDVLVLADYSFLHMVILNFIDGNDESEMAIFSKVINHDNNMDIDELFEIATNILQKRHLFWDVIEFGGAKYINLVTSDGQYPFSGTWDDYTVLEFNISSFKVPTIIITKN